jgi:uncharacterized protein YbjT (DUF2867 family)
VHTLVHLVGGPLPERGVTVDWLNLETTRIALRAAANAEVPRVLFLSPAGDDSRSENEYLTAKARAEEVIRASGLEFAIFRCAPILGSGGTLETFLERGVTSRLRDIRVNPIAVDDAVAALVSADTRSAEVRGTWELGGPDALTFGELADRTGARGGLLSRPPRELAELYGESALADPSAAVEQFGLTLTPLDEALRRG